MRLFHFNNLKWVIHSLEDLIKKILEVCQQALWEEEVHIKRGMKGRKEKKIKKQRPRKKAVYSCVDLWNALKHLGWHCFKGPALKHQQGKSSWKAGLKLGAFKKEPKSMHAPRIVLTSGDRSHELEAWFWMSKHLPAVVVVAIAMAGR